MRFLYSLWLAAITLDAIAATLAGWFLVRLYRALDDERTKRLVLYFALAIFGAAFEAGLSRLAAWWPQEVTIIMRSTGRFVETATMAMLALKLLGYINGHAGWIGRLVERLKRLVAKLRRKPKDH